MSVVQRSPFVELDLNENDSSDKNLNKWLTNSKYVQRAYSRSGRTRICKIQEICLSVDRLCSTMLV